ncbi:MAG: hypothetical protein AAFR38_14480 [Planctomycetota bacterium]
MHRIVIALAALSGLGLGLGLGLAGCHHKGPQNPSWTLTDEQTRERWEALRADPIEPERPIVYIGGYGMPRSVIGGEARSYTSAVTDEYQRDVLHVGLGGLATLEEAADDVVRMVNEKWPPSAEQAEAGETVEVDVIGMSTGGVVARLAHLPDPHGVRDRLMIRRLITIAAPHRGAEFAEFASNDQMVDDIRPRSLALTKLQEKLPKAEYELIPYGVAGDKIVGLRNSAPWGELPIWTQGRANFSHVLGQDDARLRLDIALRLRGEEPILAEDVPLP